MEPPLIVNFDSNASVRFMQITMQVASHDPAVIEKVKEHTPAIRNGLLMLYSSQDPTVLSTRQGKEALLKQSLEEVNRVLTEQSGEGGVENVYFTGFVMQ
ncbi:MAG: flagellar basal body-associated FliL family protein [Gammaproteobacteria bacterium]|nr:flagellar basal body-associated FliL family protein [Gammaproteobacteria bacterium]